MKHLIWIVVLSALGAAGAYGVKALNLKMKNDKVYGRVEQVMTSVAEGEPDLAGFAYFGRMDRPLKQAGAAAHRWISETAIGAAIGPDFTWEVLEIVQDMEGRIAKVRLTIKDDEHTLMVPWDDRMYFQDERR